MCIYVWYYDLSHNTSVEGASPVNEHQLQDGQDGDTTPTCQDTRRGCKSSEGKGHRTEKYCCQGVKELQGNSRTGRRMIYHKQWSSE